MGDTSSSSDEETIIHQFDWYCKKVLKGEFANYKNHLAYGSLQIKSQG